eukprot:TRINITY_DN8570_c0_g1_i3.p1 TRINITY_DN8570_c0_g1~~TRINITY_DN8570_c0_g1_i3.p1  ORF type:complete len:288 (-),score=21.07 TRINITY_DN8570_c0_g1_i3:16-774(-)
MAKRKSLDSKEEDVSDLETKIEIVLPGDDITLGANVKTRIGQGLTQHQNSVIATKSGFLQRDASNRVWVDSHQKRYVPVVEDNVVGVIREKLGEYYKIDIGASHNAILPLLAFEGATKRNRPNLQVGAVVYGRIVVANKDMEPEFSCISPHFKKEWMTGQSVFGELTGGMLSECPLSLARKLLQDDCLVLRCLAQHLPFELAVGVNGRFWVNSGSVLHTIIINNAILNSQTMPDAMIELMVQKLVERAASIS